MFENKRSRESSSSPGADNESLKVTAQAVRVTKRDPCAGQASHGLYEMGDVAFSPEAREAYS